MSVLPQKVLQVNAFGSYAETVGALQAMQWITPRYIVEGVLGSGVRVVNADNGFTEIYRRMLDLEGLEPEFDSEVLVNTFQFLRGPIYYILERCCTCMNFTSNVFSFSPLKGPEMAISSC